MLHVQHISEHVKTLLSGLTFVDDDGIVQIATFDEVGLKQWLYVAYKDEGTGTGYLISLFQWVFKRCKLAVDKL